MNYIEIDSPTAWWNYWAQQKGVVLDIVYSMLPQEQIKDVEKWEKDQDWENLLGALHEAWWRLPDSPRIHSLPGFSPLCYLCSEEGVFRDVE